MLERLAQALGPLVVGAAALTMAVVGLDWLWLYASSARLGQVLEQGVDGAETASMARLPAAAAVVVGVQSALAKEGYPVSTASIQATETGGVGGQGLLVHASVPFVPIVGLWSMPGTVSADILVAR